MNMKGLTLVAVTLITASTAYAAPSINKAGQCYTFKNDTVSTKSDCAISIEHDRNKGKSISLKLADKTHNIEAQKNGKNYLDSTFTIDGEPASHYLRNAATNKQASLVELESVNGDALYCYKAADMDICHN